jgi:hypothetical protein
MTNIIKGGKSDGMSIEDIAKKHKIDVDLLKIQLEKGIKVEKEHTNNNDMAKEIAMDHLFEFPDYYIKLEKMEKEETKEQTMADASGSFEGPIFSAPILKRDIHNFTLNEMDGIPGMGYDGPIGHGKVSPMDKKNKPANPLKLDKPRTASITAASTKNMKAKQKGFPKFGGPDAKFVEIDDRCKTYPYCNQGDDGQIKLVENKEMKEAIKEAAKKYGLTVEEIQKMVMKEVLPVGMLDSPGNKKAMKSWTDKGEKTIYHIMTKHPIDIKTEDDVEVAKLKIILHNHDIHFHEEVIKK